MSDPEVTTESAGAVSGSCSLCSKPATRKVGEEIPYDDPMRGKRHNLTAYVCDEHFAAIFSPRRAASEPSVRVRIAVAVDEHGEWEVAMRNEEPAEAATYLLGRIAWSFVEADVPLPLAPQTIQGSVANALTD
jgi:hypothetical protein